jgi:hypothetical protein
MKLKDKILRLKEKGCSYKVIQEKLKCSKGTISYHLGIGQKDKTNARRKDTRSKIRKYIQEYKSNQICADCKENYPYWILDFDHLDNKKFNIGTYKNNTISLRRVKDEIKKCEVVCSNCHRNRTFQRRLKDAKDVGLEYCDYPE